MRKEQIVQYMVQRKPELTIQKKMKLEFYIKPYSQADYKWIQDLNMKSKTIQFIEENVGQYLCALNIRKALLNKILKHKM